MEKTGIAERINDWAKSSVTLKLVTIGILVLILLIPSSMILKLINERTDRMHEAVSEVSSKWGNNQTITGPVISIPYKAIVKSEKGDVSEEIFYAHFLPDHLKISGRLYPEKRYRGIYKVILYQSKLTVSGEFTFPDFTGFNVPAKDILWEDAIVSMGIPDMRGIKDSLNINWNGKMTGFNPGIETKDIFNSGVSFKQNMKTGNKDEKINFTLNMNLDGSEKIDFIPFGKITEVDLSSSWPDPGFDGAFLPEKHHISDSGFKANWKILHLNRNFPQSWTGKNFGEPGEFLPPEIGNTAFGVNLVQTVDEYQKTTRSAKYDIIFIVLTFLIFFFVEMINKVRIHPIQYLLVGFAITLFYVMLLSLSEHLTFNLSYLLSAIAVILLVLFYSKNILKSFKLAFLTTMIITVLYAFFFVILQMQDYALLFGSIGLFVVLAVVMYLSRNINWYSLKTKTE